MFLGSWLVPGWQGRGSPRLKAGVKPAAWGRQEASIAPVAFGVSFAHPQLLFWLHILKAREGLWDRRHFRGSANITLQNPTKTLQPYKNPRTLQKPFNPTKTLQSYKNPTTLQKPYNPTKDRGKVHVHLTLGLADCNAPGLHVAM